MSRIVTPVSTAALLANIAASAAAAASAIALPQQITAKTNS